MIPCVFPAIIQPPAAQSKRKTTEGDHICPLQWGKSLVLGPTSVGTMAATPLPDLKYVHRQCACSLLGPLLSSWVLMSLSPTSTRSASHRAVKDLGADLAVQDSRCVTLGFLRLLPLLCHTPPMTPFMLLGCSWRAGPLRRKRLHRK